MFGPSLAVSWLRAGLGAAALVVEAQAVLGLRLTGLAGWHRLPPGEAALMAVEKPAAFLHAFAAWQGAALSGADLPQQALAYERPLTAAARANRRRLTRA